MTISIARGARGPYLLSISKSKSPLKHKLQVTISERNCPISDTMTYDVSALVWVITWPSGKLGVYVDAFKAFVHQALRRADVILVFDRYFPNSINTFTRTQRSGSSRVYKLTPDAQVPAKQVVLILIAQHAMSLSLLGESVSVVCDDTVVFGLLVHYYNSRCKCSNSAPMTMSSPVKERAVIYIRATVESHSDVADDLLAIHALSGTDAVSSLHGIGKATVVKVAKKGCFPLFCIGDVHAEIKSVEAHATKFTCASYGKVAESCNSMTQCRVKMWRSKTGKSGASSVKLCSIPPTTEAFKDVCTGATFKWQYREDGRFFKCHCTKCCTPSGKCCLRPL